MRILLTIVVVGLVVLVLAGWFFGAGVYNIAATEPHSDLGRWLFTTVRNQSIERHSETIVAPSRTSASVRDGAGHYEENCVACHGAPGKEASEFAKGLNPEPPDLTAGNIQSEYSEAEIYWIVKHGIRMTGMPAFGPTHGEEDLWNLVAFIEKLPEMNAEEYDALTQSKEQDASPTKEQPQ